MIDKRQNSYNINLYVYNSNYYAHRVGHLLFPSWNKNMEGILKETKGINMILKDWDVWLNYAWYYIDDFAEMQSIAYSLIDDDLCKLVYDSNGYIYWKVDGRIKHEKLEIIQFGHEPKAKINFPKGLNDYPLEGAYQSSKMRWYEMFLLNLGKFSYIRGFLGACYFKINDKTIILYPQIKLYSNGVFMLSHRIISPKDAYAVKDFIESEINLFRFNAENINVPPELMKLDTRASIFQSKAGLVSRLSNFRFIRFFDELVDKNTKSIRENFDFSACPLKVPNEIKYTDGPMNLDLLNDMIGSSLTYIINGKTVPFKYFIRGLRLKKQLGAFWIGQPSIYILSFKKQPKSSNAAVRRFKDSINRILLRTTSGRLKSSGYSTWNDLRVFDDYSFFMNEGIFLFVFGKDGLNSDIEYADPNRGHLIYNKQVLIEALIFNYMSHHRQYERANIMQIPTKKVIREQHTLFDLEELIEKSSNWGEIQDVFRFSSEMFNLGRLREKTDKSLALRTQHTSEQLNKSLRYFGLLISILFGLLGIFSFTHNIIKPVWELFNLWLPIKLQIKDLYLHSISLCFVLIVIYIIWKKIFSKD